MNKKENYNNNTFIKFYSFLLKNLNMKKIKSIMYYFDRIICLFIKKPKYIVDKKKKILIIFNLALGDGVVFLNAISNIDSIYPKNDYSITIACQKGLNKIYEEVSSFDRVIPLNFTKATVNIKERIKCIKILNDTYYDIVLDPVGANECFTNVLMTRNVMGKEKIGCLMSNDSKICPKHILKRTYSNIKEIRSKSLIEQYYEFFYNKYSVKLCNLPKKKFSLKLPKKYFIVFPSASMELKKWPIEYYAEIIKRIYKKVNIPVVFCGTDSDRESFMELSSLIGDIPYIDIISKTSMLEFIDVIDKAKFVITNDTGTYHIAYICQVPVAIVTGGYTYDRYVTYDYDGCEKYRRPYVIVHKMNCFNCGNNCSRIKKGDKLWPCLNNITVDYAWKIIDEMIDKEL